jgi:iron complex outermembrane recepter protein
MNEREILRSVLLASSVLALPAFAQTNTQGAPANAAPTQGADVLQEVVVTAQKRSERIQDVPLSITAVSGDQLIKQGVTSPADLERVVPGFTYALSQYGNPIFTIRGVGFYDEAVSAQPDVTVYVDQMPLPYSHMTEGAGLDLERVEVLKGPQGTLFGQNATGGVINYIAAKPTSDLHYGFDSDIGRFDEFNFGGFVSGPITDDLTARLAARTEQRGDWQTSITRNASLGERDFSEGRLLLDWKASDRLKFELNLNGWHDGSDVQQYQARGYLPSNPAPPGTPQTIETAAILSAYPYPTSNNNRLADWDPNTSFRRNDRQYQSSLRGDYQLSDSFTLTSLTNYVKLQTYAPIDLDGTSYNESTLQQYGGLSTVSQELRFEGDVNDRVHLVLGGYYQHDNTNDFENVYFIGSTSELGGVAFNGATITDFQKVNIAAGFAGIDYKLTDTLTIEGSARYTEDRTDFKGCTADAGGPEGWRFAPPLPSYNGGAGVAEYGCATIINPATLQSGYVLSSLDQNNVAWKGSLDWKPVTDTLVYFSASKGYKSGSFADIPAIISTSLTPVVQESVLSYELGTKTALFERRIEFDAAAFDYDYDNKQTQGYVNSPFGVFQALINIPKSTVHGGEISATLRPFTGFHLSGGVTYVDAKVSGVSPVLTASGTEENVGGEQLPLTPQWQLVGDTEYDHPLSSDWNGFIGGSVSYRSSTNATFGDDPRFEVDGYALVDARLGIESADGIWRIQLWGKNILNKNYWNDVVKISDTYGRLTGMPATYGISVSMRH